MLASVHQLYERCQKIHSSNFSDVQMVISATLRLLEKGELKTEIYVACVERRVVLRADGRGAHSQYDAYTALRGIVQIHLIRSNAETANGQEMACML